MYAIEHWSWWQTRSGQDWRGWRRLALQGGVHNHTSFRRTRITATEAAWTRHILLMERPGITRNLSMPAPRSARGVTRQPLQLRVANPPLFINTDIRLPVVLRELFLGPELSPKQSVSSLRLLKPFTRLFYNDFTTTDWVMLYIRLAREEFADQQHRRTLLRSRLEWTLSRFSAYILLTLILLSAATLAFLIDKTEAFLVGFKSGYCRTNWLLSRESCCGDIVSGVCSSWRDWLDVFEHEPVVGLDFAVYVTASIVFASAACVLSLTTLSDPGNGRTNTRPVYTAVGSGVPEVRTILSGFVIRRFLGTYTLLIKTLALVPLIASGLALGKEGPYVHLATCVGNVLLRLFPRIHNNEVRQKQILTAACSAGVALAFGLPLGGVLFTLEEINNHLPPKQLFKVFFCAILSTICLKFWDPYGTGNTVLFEVKYGSDWRAAEMVFFVILGIAGGVFGAGMVHFIRWWPKVFRSRSWIKGKPVREVVIVAAVTAFVSYPNKYTKLAPAELLRDLATSCTADKWGSPLCPMSRASIETSLWTLGVALVIKTALTFITFGLHLPAGIYVPSMVAGALFGRLFALAVEWCALAYPGPMQHICAVRDTLDAGASQLCVDMGIYLLIAAGAFMAGVTRMNMTLVTIMFELTLLYTYVIPIAIAIAVSNWCGALWEPHLLYEAILIERNFPFVDDDTAGPFDPKVQVADLLSPAERSSSTLVETTPLIGLEPLLPQTSRQGWLYAIDVSETRQVLAGVLAEKVALLKREGLYDGSIPIVERLRCIGLVGGADLELRIDKITEFQAQYGLGDEMCWLVDEAEEEWDLEDQTPREQYASTLRALLNLTLIVDRNPIYVNHDLEVALVQLMFDRLGVKNIVVNQNGVFYGVLHKKTFVDFCNRH